MRRMRVLAVVNFKGGSSKTTSAVHLAHVLHEQGGRVLLVDADPQGSAQAWADLAELPMTTVGMATPRLHSEVPGFAEGRFEWVVIDTPPLADEGKRQGIVASALRLASVVIVPVAPTPLEYNELGPVRDAIADSAPTRPSGHPPETFMLLTRTNASAAAPGVFRDLMRGDGDRVLRATVARRERFAQSFGQRIERATATAYGDAVAEVLESLGAPA